MTTTPEIQDADWAALAEAEVPCPCEPQFLENKEYCSECSYSDLTNDGREVFLHSQSCIPCKGTGRVAKHEWARVTCDHRQGSLSELTKADWIAKHDADCPSYRPTTLAEATQRLEAILVSVQEADEEHSYFTFKYRAIKGWCLIAKFTDTLDEIPYGSTPTIAAVRAILAMEEASDVHM